MARTHGYKTRDHLSWEQWQELRNNMIRQWLGMTSDDLPDLRFYRDEFDDGMDYDQSAALLVADVATEFGQNVVELCPEAAKLI